MKDLRVRARQRREALFRVFPSLRASFLDNLGEEKTAAVFEEMERADEQKARRSQLPPIAAPRMFGNSVPTLIGAAVDILREAGHPMTLREMVAAVEARGFVINAATPNRDAKANALGASLSSRAARYGEIAKVPGRRPVLWTAAQPAGRKS